MNRKKNRNRRSGLTLLEMLVVLAIIALVVGLGAPRMVESFGRAKSQAAVVAMSSLKGAIQLYHIDTGRYPTEAEGLSALLERPSDSPGWRGPYVDNRADLTDPWGRRYLYSVPGNDTPFSVSTLGRDGQPGGDGEDSDISL